MRHNLFASVCLLLSALVLSRAGAVDKSADVRFFNASNADNVDDISSSFHSRTLLSAARRPIGEGGAEAVEAPPNLIHGHIIPHSHCDPGWLQTFEVFFSNSPVAFQNFCNLSHVCVNRDITKATSKTSSPVL
jgi:hypothetical protein